MCLRFTSGLDTLKSFCGPTPFTSHPCVWLPITFTGNTLEIV